MSMAKNSNLNAAKDVQNDEFYIQYEDIQAELNHYEKHFKWKTVPENCQMLCKDCNSKKSDMY